MSAGVSSRNNYEVVIGIEVHVQLTTHTKIFCSCANQVTKKPNSNICQICSGYPGTLPVLNKKAVEYATLAGLAMNCTINRLSHFDRKHYFYPDLPKGFQITQNDRPICLQGYIPIKLEDGSLKKIRLHHMHMEEDAGKNLHATDYESFVDLNRAGTPLLEIVSEPDIRSSFEAKAYLRMLHLIVQYLKICTGNMEEGAFRADTNISVRKKGQKEFGTKVELKNINSFKYIGDAIEYEVDRQIEILESGGSISQETRLWDTKKHQTFIMRKKEGQADYRFFQEPDLPIIEITDQFIEHIKKQLPELPHKKFDRFVNVLGLTPYEADILIEDRDLADYFEQAYAYSKSKLIINWVLRDVIGYLKDKKIPLAEFKVTPSHLVTIISLIESNEINNQAAKIVFEEVAISGNDPRNVVAQKGLKQIGSSEELEKIIDNLLQENANEVARYKAGEQKLFGFFVGEAMKKTQGKGNPKIIQELLKNKLS